MQVAVCGAGRGGLAIAGDLALSGHQVSLFQMPAFIDSFKEVMDKGIVITGDTYSGKTGKVKPYKVTVDPEEALSEAEVVMIAVPANAHEDLFKYIAPYFRNGQVVIVNTGYWASLRFRDLLKSLNKDVLMAESEILPYLCHIVSDNHVHIDAKKDSVYLAAVPNKNNKKVLEIGRKLIPSFIEANSILETNLMSINTIIHIPIVLMSTTRIETLGDEPCHFYSEGVTPKACRLIESVDREKTNLAEALGIEVPTAIERVKAMYGHAGANGDTVYEVERNDIPAQGFVFETANSVYHTVEEDVPYGLVPMMSLGDILGVELPTISSITHIMSEVQEENFGDSGFRFDKLGVNNLSQIREII